MPQFPYIGPTAISLSQHDKLDALQRWFEDWKSERHEAFPWGHQWMTVEAKTWTSPRGRKHTRYVGIIGDYDKTDGRKVQFEHDAPPPPVFRLDVRKIPPPPAPRRTFSRPPLRLNDYEVLYAHQQEAVIRAMQMPSMYLARDMRFIDDAWDMPYLAPQPPPPFTGSNQ